MSGTSAGTAETAGGQLGAILQAAVLSFLTAWRCLDSENSYLASGGGNRNCQVSQGLG